MPPKPRATRKPPPAAAAAAAAKPKPRTRAKAKAQPAPVPKTVEQAAANGTRRELLVALRDRVATAVADPRTAARDLAALTRRLMEIAKDIEALDLSAQREGRAGALSPDEKLDASAL